MSSEICTKASGEPNKLRSTVGDAGPMADDTVPPGDPIEEALPPLGRTGVTTSLTILCMRASTLACKFGLALVIARYFDLLSLGLFGLAAGAVTIVPVVASLGMVHIIMRDAVTLPLAQLTDHLQHYWLFTISVYALLLALTVTGTVALDASWLWTIVVAIALFEHIGNDAFQLLTNLDRPLLANSNAFIRGAAWVLIYVPLAVWDPDFRSLSILFGFWLAGSVIALLHFAWTTRNWPWKFASLFPFSTGWLRTTIKKSFIVYLSDLSFVASQQSDRYVVTVFMGLPYAGIYFLYWSVANAVSTLVTTMLQVRRPHLIKAFRDGGAPAHRRLASESMRATVLASLVLSAIAFSAFYLLVPLLKQPAVANYLGALVLIMAGMTMRNVADMGAMALFTARRDNLMTLTNIAAVVALVISQIVLLPIAGLYGGGAAILIAFGAIAIWRHWLLFGAPGVRAPVAAPDRPSR
jgi:O-antigen/teichoic acid export membrane protein